jgi:hypothetical protein
MPRRQNGSPIGAALVWAYRIIAVSVAMFAPAVAGGWLDHRLGTSFWGPAGLVVGFVGGLVAILQATRPSRGEGPPSGRERDPAHVDDARKR